MGGRIPKVAVVTGSNKGIGFAVVKALLQAPFDGVVYLTARDVGRGQAAVVELKKLGLEPRFHQLDITSTGSIAAFRDHIRSSYRGLDVLVNNAGIAFPGDSPEPFGLQAAETMDINYFGILNLCRELFPLLRPGARIVNVSSGVGHLCFIPGADLRAQLGADDLTEERLSQLMTEYVRQAHAEGAEATVAAGWPKSTPEVNSAYIVSKVALCALTRNHQRFFDTTRPGEDILVNSCRPGFVDTDMTAHLAPTLFGVPKATPDQGAKAPTCLALLPTGSELRGAYVWYDTEVHVMDWAHDQFPPRPAAASAPEG